MIRQVYLPRSAPVWRAGPRIRVLHVLWEAHHAGGIECWLQRVAAHRDPARMHCEVLILSRPRPGRLVDALQRCGVAVHFCATSPHRPGGLVRELRRLQENRGPFDAVHVHTHYFSGRVVQAAGRVGIAHRIVHSHGDLRPLVGRASLLRRWYWRHTAGLIARHATGGLAVSARAADDLFGSQWPQDARWQVFPTAIDLRPFERPVDRGEVRRELGLSPAALVVGHVGRFAPEKNHVQIVEVFQQVRRRRADARLVLVGDGPLRSAVEGRVRAAGLAGDVIFTGLVEEVSRVMRGAMDVFVFPSLVEGLGLAVLEAQAAGLPIVMSDDVPVDACAIPKLIRRLSRAEPAAVWADAVLDAVGSPPRLCPSPLEILRETPFCIERNTRLLEGFYASLVTGESDRGVHPQAA